LINDFKAYFIRHGQPIYENPSPGNVAGGLTTLEEKSLGAIQKGGRAPVTQVLRYGAPAATGAGGLALLDSPGNDGVSSTDQLADDLFALILDVASGRALANNEKHGYREIAIWKEGVTL